MKWSNHPLDQHNRFVFTSVFACCVIGVSGVIENSFHFIVGPWCEQVEGSTVLCCCVVCECCVVFMCYYHVLCTEDAHVVTCSLLCNVPLVPKGKRNLTVFITKKWFKSPELDWTVHWTNEYAWLQFHGYKVYPISRHTHIIVRSPEQIYFTAHHFVTIKRSVWDIVGMESLCFQQIHLGMLKTVKSNSIQLAVCWGQNEGYQGVSYTLGTRLPFKLKSIQLTFFLFKLKSNQLTFFTPFSTLNLWGSHTQIVNTHHVLLIYLNIVFPFPLACKKWVPPLFPAELLIKTVSSSVVRTTLSEPSTCT